MAFGRVAPPRTPNRPLVVVLRNFFETFRGEPYTFNLDLIELCSTSADQITVALLDCLNKYELNQQFITECFVCFACNGGSVMIDKNSGVDTRLKKMIPHLIIWHCSNYRLELAVNDVVNEVAGINNFKIFKNVITTNSSHVSCQNLKYQQENIYV